MVLHFCLYTTSVLIILDIPHIKTDLLYSVPEMLSAEIGLIISRKRA